MYQKPPKSSHKSPFFLVQEILILYNLRTANAIKMKFTRIVYLHETFHLTKDLRANYRVWQGVAQKPPKKAPKLGFWVYFLENFTTISKTAIYVM